MNSSSKALCFRIFVIILTAIIWVRTEDDCYFIMLIECSYANIVLNVSIIGHLHNIALKDLP